MYAIRSYYDQDAAQEGIRRILEAHGASLNDGVIGSVRMGSTVATNSYNFV